MNAFTIKIIAVALMLIDHVGLFFFPNNLNFRLIGRLSFPLFAWLLANSAYYTHDINKYLYRLLLFSVISQVPYILSMRLLDPHFSGLNILFTLAIGLFVIIGIKKIQNKLYWPLITLLCGLFAQLINADYGFFGVLVIVTFYLYFHNKLVLLLTQSFLFLTYSVFGYLNSEIIMMIQFIGLGALGITYYYNHKRGKSLKYSFYFAFPLQYILIYIIFLLQK